LEFKLELISNYIKNIGYSLSGTVGAGVMGTARLAGRTVEPAVALGGALYAKGLFYQTAPALITKGCVSVGRALAGRYLGAGLGKLIAPVIISYTMTPGALVAALAGGYLANKTLKGVSSVFKFTANTLNAAPKQIQEKKVELPLTQASALEVSEEFYLATVS